MNDKEIFVPGAKMTIPMEYDIAALRAEVERLTKERDEANRNLGKAAMEIHVAGPVDHRIRVMRKEYQDEIERLMAALNIIASAVMPVQTELGMVAFEDVQDLIDIARQALKGSSE